MSAQDRSIGTEGSPAIEPTAPWDRSVAVRLVGATADYFAMPATTDAPHVSISARRAVELSFTAHPRAVIARASGRLVDVAVRPRSGAVSGGETLDWVHVEEPYEGVAILPDPSLLRALAEELRAPAAADLGEVPLIDDAVLWAAAVRLRAHALGGQPLTDLEGDEMARRVFGHLICERFGGRPQRRNMRPLDARRLARVTDFLDARLGGTLRVDDLAREAAMSPFHFIGAFRAATGLTPHAFATARRMERARALLARGLTRAEVAVRVGYTPGHGFRHALARHGC